MSPSASIKVAGDKMSAFVKLKGGNSSKVDQGVTKSTSILEENEEETGYGEAADQTVATFEAVVGSIEKFESGDPTQITIGVLDILTEVSQFAALAGPTGAIIAAVVGPLCTIMSSLLGAGTGEPVESEEDMLKRVVSEALAVETFECLQAEARGVTEQLSDNIRRTRTFLDMGDNLGSGDKSFILNMAGSDSGNSFLAKLSHYMKATTKDDKEAGRTAQLVTSYVNIAYVRLQYLYMLASLLGGDETSKGVAKDTQDEAEDLISDAKNVLQSFLRKPDVNNHVVYSKVYLEPLTTLDLMEGICKMKNEGRLMAIYNTKQKNYLHVSQSKDDHSEAKTNNISVFYSMYDDHKFVVFGSNSNKVEIFSVDHAGYVYADDYNPVDDDRRCVRGWKIDEHFTKGEWEVSNHDTYGKVKLRNILYNEYMYAADYNASGTTHPVYTWRPGNSVNQGYWIFEDLKVPGDVKRIHNAWSGLHLNGQQTMNEGNDTIVLCNFRPDYPHYYDWFLLRLSDGTYNIKSRSSNMFLHGRHLGIGNGPHVGLWHLSQEKASNISEVKWFITEHIYEGRTCYAIQSVSSKLYLDGRNSDYIGAKMLWLVNRNPEGDRHLMWDLQ